METDKRQSGFGNHISVRFHGNMAIVEMDRGENRLNLDFFKRMNAALDEVERNPEAKALVTTGKGKFFSNGIDLNWLGEATQEDPSLTLTFRRGFMGLMRRILTFPMPTIAALNGHAYAGGAFLCLAHDYRVMRIDRGWFCINEVHLGMFLGPLLRELVRTKIRGGHTFSDAVVMGKRLTGPEAVQAGIVSSVYSPERLQEEVTSLVKRVLPPGGFKRFNMAEMKKGIYENIIAKYDEDVGKSAKL